MNLDAGTLTAGAGNLARELPKFFWHFFPGKSALMK